MGVSPLCVTAFTATCAAGVGASALAAALRSRRSGLRPNDFSPTPLGTWIGRVPGLEDRPLPAPLAAWDCRNNRLALLGLDADGFRGRVAAARERYGAHRVALVVGTSTASIAETEEGYRLVQADGQFPPHLC